MGKNHASQYANFGSLHVEQVCFSLNLNTKVDGSNVKRFFVEQENRMRQRAV